MPNSATRYQQRLYINETSGEALFQLIEYAYTSKITISGEVVGNNPQVFNRAGSVVQSKISFNEIFR